MLLLLYSTASLGSRGTAVDDRPNRASICAGSCPCSSRLDGKMHVRHVQGDRRRQTRQFGLHLVTNPVGTAAGDVVVVTPRGLRLLRLVEVVLFLLLQQLRCGDPGNQHGSSAAAAAAIIVIGDDRDALQPPTNGTKNQQQQHGCQENQKESGWKPTTTTTTKFQRHEESRQKPARPAAAAAAVTQVIVYLRRVMNRSKKGTGRLLLPHQIIDRGRARDGLLCYHSLSFRKDPRQVQPRYYCNTTSSEVVEIMVSVYVVR